MEESKKKILLISNSFWNFYNFRKDLIIKLNKKYDLILLASDDKYKKFFLKKKVKVKEIYIKRNQKNLFSLVILFFNLLIFIKSQKPNLLLFYTIKPNLVGSIIAKFLKINYINIITGLGSGFVNSLILKKILIIFYKFSLSNSKKIIVQNKQDFIFFKKKILYSSKSLKIIPGSGVKINKITPKIKKNKNLRYLYVGRLIKDKGINELFQAIIILKKKYTNLIFNIVGNIDFENLKPIKKNKLNFMIKHNLINHFIFTNKVNSFYKKNDFFILPSFREGTSKSLLEAASYGLPLLASNVPGCSNVVLNNYNGYLFKPRSTMSIVQTIEKSIKLNTKKRLLFSRNSLKIVKEKFSNNKINKMFMKEIELILTNSKNK